MNILSDYRVVECASNIAGPYCGKLFADAGAEVIKVEPADGDPLRRRAVHGEELAGRDAALFRFLNAGKTSLIGRPGDDAVADLVANADVLVEDHVPAQFDIDDLRRRFPALVIVSITPYGRQSSWADRPANDFIVQAESGTLAVRGDPDRPPFQVGGRLTEYIAGTYAAVGAIAAAREAKKSGCGQWLDCASIESTNITFSVFTDLAASIAGVKVSGPPRRVREYPSIEPTLDGWVGFNTNTAQMWESLLLMIGQSDLIGDPDWAVFNRMARGEETTDMVRAFTTTKTTAEIVEEASRLRNSSGTGGRWPERPGAPAVSGARFLRSFYGWRFHPSAAAVHDRRRAGETPQSRSAPWRAHRPDRPAHSCSVTATAGQAARRPQGRRRHGLVGRSIRDPTPRVPGRRSDPRGVH